MLICCTNLLLLNERAGKSLIDVIFHLYTANDSRVSRDDTVEAGREHKKCWLCHAKLKSRPSYI